MFWKFDTVTREIYKNWSLYWDISINASETFKKLMVRKYKIYSSYFHPFGILVIIYLLYFLILDHLRPVCRRILGLLASCILLLFDS